MKMHKLISFLLALVVILWVSAASASDYVLSNGYYWLNGQAYTRYSVRCCGSSNGWCWKYYPVNVASGYAANGYSASAGGTEGWRKQLLDIVATHKRYQDQIAASANEQNEFLEAVRELGLTKIIQPYGYAPTLADPDRVMASLTAAANGQYVYAPYAQQGNTVYGYQEFAKAYGALDHNLFMNQANNHTVNAQQLAGKAEQGYKALAADLAAGSERLAEIQVRAQAAAMALAATAPQPQAETRKVFFQAEVGSNGQLSVRQADSPPPQQTATARQQALGAYLTNKCVSCHGPDKPKGGIDLTKYFTFDENTKRKVRAAMMWSGDNQDKWMPRKADGSIGDRPEFDEVVLFQE